MEAKIKETELAILAYLHEHAKGYTQEYQVPPGEIAQAMGLKFEDFERDASFLRSFGLVGMETIDVSSNTSPNEYWLQGIWLTGLGENYMRELEQAPGVTRKITVGVVKEIFGAVKDAANTLLVGYMTGIVK